MKKGVVPITFEYLGKEYSYDLMKEAAISDVVDQDRREIPADIGFISAVLLEHIKQKNHILNTIDNFCRDAHNISKVTNQISMRTGKAVDKISQSQVNDNFDMFPQYTAMKDTLSKIENTIRELENFKWTLVNKSNMLSVIRQ